MISLRTFVNTTLFWLSVCIVFWGYTRFIHDEPAKQLLYAIGWHDLGNLTITQTQVFSFDNQSDVIKKLDMIEKMIVATNMSCAMKQTTDTLESKSSDTSQSNGLRYPLFNKKINKTLSPDQQFGPQSLMFIQRDASSTATDIRALFQEFIAFELSEEEKKQGAINVFQGTQLSLEQYKQQGSQLVLTISGYKNLSAQDQQLVSTLLHALYIQLPYITTVIVQ